MWRNLSPCALLVYVPTISENIKWLNRYGKCENSLKKFQNKETMWPSNPTPGHTSKWTEIRSLEEVSTLLYPLYPYTQQLRYDELYHMAVVWYVQRIFRKFIEKMHDEKIMHNFKNILYQHKFIPKFHFLWASWNTLIYIKYNIILYVRKRKYCRVQQNRRTWRKSAIHRRTNTSWVYLNAVVSILLSAEWLGRGGNAGSFQQL